VPRPPRAALLLLLAACTQNHAELRAALADSERELAGLEAVADTLTDRRRRTDLLEERLRAVMKGVEPAPLPPAAPLPPVPPPRTLVLPPTGRFEGAEGARLRARIAEAQARIAELRRVIGEVEALDALRAKLAEELEAKIRDGGER